MLSICSYKYYNIYTLSDKQKWHTRTNVTAKIDGRYCEIILDIFQILQSTKCNDSLQKTNRNTQKLQETKQQNSITRYIRWIKSL